MRLNTTGIAARMMLSLDKKAIGEKLINGRQINPTPLQVRYPQGVREVLGIMSEQLAISTADLTRILLEDALHNMFMPADNTAGNIISRIEYIMLSHDINAPLLATITGNIAVAMEYPLHGYTGPGQTCRLSFS